MIIRRPTATTPAAGRFEGFDKDNFIDDVFEVDVEGGERPSGWVLPPSLMAVAAVPGAPVINQVAPEARVPKDVREEEVVGVVVGSVGMTVCIVVLLGMVVLLVVVLLRRIRCCVCNS